MKNIFSSLVGFLVFISITQLSEAQSCPLCGSLEVKVTGIRSNQGVVRILLTFDKQSFIETDPKKLSLSKVFFRNEKAIVSGVTFRFSELQPRPYAFKIFHDENANEVLDVSLIGRPLEGLAFSELKPKTKNELKPGAYAFEKITFRIPPSKKLTKTVTLLY